MNYSRTYIFAAMLTGAALASASAVASTFEVVHRLGESAPGCHTGGPLLQTADGSLYGTYDYDGGVYKIDTDHVFSNYSPWSNSAAGSLATTPDGTIWGITGYGGTYGLGTIFRVPLFGVREVVHSFEPRSASVSGGLTYSPDGWLYGVTYGDNNNNAGTIYRISQSGKFQILYEFSINSLSGTNPRASLIADSKGTLYGTCSLSGKYFGGTIFRLVGGKKFEVIHHFNNPTNTGPEGGNPQGELYYASNGFLYGTTTGGGPDGQGTLFKIQPNGRKYRTIHTARTKTEDPKLFIAGLIEYADGQLYGTSLYGGASNNGTIFRVAKDGSTFTVLQNFGPGLGSGPAAELRNGPEGWLWSNTSQSGTSGCSVIYRFMP